MGKTFVDVVLDPKKDVLLITTAIDCITCRELLFDLENLAKNFRNIDNLVLATLDSDKNELAGMKIKRNPTILLFPQD